MKEVLVYILEVEDEPTEYWFFPKDEVLAQGGVETLERKLGETCLWFSPLGEMQLTTENTGASTFRLESIRNLADAWRARGAPRRYGRKLM
jgi:hypothetical protein